MAHRIGSIPCGLAIVVAILLLSGCSSRPDESGGPMRVWVSIPPQAELVERIGGDRVDVEVLAEAGQDPHTFEPAPKQIMALGRARLFFTAGMPFETRLVDKIAAGSKRLEVVDTTHGLDCDGAHEHHHHDHDHACTGGDPHVWLSPPALKVQAATIAETLARADPPGKELFEANLKKLTAELDALDARVGKRLAPFRGRTIYVYHAALGPFCKAYGLVQKAVQIEGRAPTPRRVRALVKQARADGVKVIFVQPQFDQRTARTVADALGGAVVPLDPLAPDILENIERIAEAIAGALAEKSGKSNSR